jgi:hypothetical protein
MLSVNFTEGRHNGVRCEMEYASISPPQRREGGWAAGTSLSLAPYPPSSPLLSPQIATRAAAAAATAREAQTRRGIAKGAAQQSGSGEESSGGGEAGMEEDEGRGPTRDEGDMSGGRREAR